MRLPRGSGGRVSAVRRVTAKIHLYEAGFIRLCSESKCRLDCRLTYVALPTGSYREDTIIRVRECFCGRVDLAKRGSPFPMVPHFSNPVTCDSPSTAESREAPQAPSAPSQLYKSSRGSLSANTSSIDVDVSLMRSIQFMSQAPYLPSRSCTTSFNLCM